MIAMGEMSGSATLTANEIGDRGGLGQRRYTASCRSRWP